MGFNSGFKGLKAMMMSDRCRNARVTEETVSAGSQTVKGKAIPLQAWTGPEGSRRLRLPDFKTVGT